MKAEEEEMLLLTTLKRGIDLQVEGRTADPTTQQEGNSKAKGLVSLIVHQSLDNVLFTSKMVLNTTQKTALISKT